MNSVIADNLLAVREAVADSARASGRGPGSVTIVAVSKTHSPEVVSEAVAAGQYVFGENKVQEARGKIPLLPGNLHWHLVGHLQSNKARLALSLFEMLEGIDSIELLRELARIGEELGVFPRVLLQVNVAGESSKFGFAPEQLIRQVEEIASVNRVQIEGLMTVPPFTSQPESVRPYFVQLRELRERLVREFELPLPHLSMGMSNDYRVAVEEGATLVRIGTAIFGERRKGGNKQA
jgi:PLP dependent protein